MTNPWLDELLSSMTVRWRSCIENQKIRGIAGRIPLWSGSVFSGLLFALALISHIRGVPHTLGRHFHHLRELPPTLQHAFISILNALRSLAFDLSEWIEKLHKYLFDLIGFGLA
jgi:hypothetical protein